MTVYIVYKYIPRSGRDTLHVFEDEELAKTAVRHYRMEETLGYYRFEYIERDIENTFIPTENP